MQAKATLPNGPQLAAGALTKETRDQSMLFRMNSHSPSRTTRPQQEPGVQPAEPQSLIVLNLSRPVLIVFGPSCRCSEWATVRSNRPGSHPVGFTCIEELGRSPRPQSPLDFANLAQVRAPSIIPRGLRSPDSAVQPKWK